MTAAISQRISAGLTFTFVVLCAAAVSGHLCRRDDGLAPIFRCTGKVIKLVPQDLPTNIETLHLRDTDIKTLGALSFYRYPELTHIIIQNNRLLTSFSGYLFNNNPRLSYITITDNPALVSLDGSTFDGRIKALRSLQLSRNALDTFPDLSRLEIDGTTMSWNLHLDGNPLTSPSAMCGDQQGDLQRNGRTTCKFLNVTISHTLMKYLPSYVLNGSEIASLDLGNNPELEGFDGDVLSYLAPETLKILMLSNNTKLSMLPNAGVDSIEVLSCQNCHSLKVIPLTIKFSRIKAVYLTYPQHCCAFRKPEIQDREAYKKKLEDEIYKCKNGSGLTPPSMPHSLKVNKQDGRRTNYIQYTGSFGRKLLAFGNVVTPAHRPNDTTTVSSRQHAWIKEFGNPVPTVNPNMTHVLTYDSNCSFIDFESLRALVNSYRENLTCTPSENPFTPCGDILEEKHGLRVLLWVVAISAIVGNVIVLSCIVTSRTKTPMTVTKFLICNLAFSDALQGIYLLTLAAVDVKSLGQYFNFANWWQYDGGCDTIGFITVFASELSVYTLSVITLERWYAISHAIHLTKRVQMRQAIIIMLIGWIFAAAMAAMPLPSVGMSGYQETSLCLPFRMDTTPDKVYIYVLLGLNMIAFGVVLVCYISIFQQVRGSNASMASDTYLARRMALLVFTDFICWGPVAIVAGLTAGGVNMQAALLTEENSLFIAKVIVVVFYPFNACANPFLYAIITKQFRKDCLQTLNYCGLRKHKIRGPKPRPCPDDSVTSAKLNTVRHSQSHISNTTQLTSSLSQTENTRAGSIKSRSSVEALIANSMNGTPCEMRSYGTRRDSSISIKDYAITVLNNKTYPSTQYSHRKKRHSIGGTVHPPCMRSISCSASTIDSIDSRRPSDTVRVPETLVEADSVSYDDQWREGITCPPLPWDANSSKEQWHRDRWLSDERNNNRYNDKNADVDSGTEMNHVSESECEDCTMLNHQHSITSSCSASANLLSHRRPSEHSVVDHTTNNSSAYDCDSESECSCLNQYYPSKGVHKSAVLPGSKSEHSHLANEYHPDVQIKQFKGRGHEESYKEEDELLTTPLTVVDNT